jgi:membrane protein insertase Oxa1/YidC/SpoIIIJ
MNLSQNVGLGMGLSTIIFALLLRLIFAKTMVNNVIIIFT